MAELFFFAAGTPAAKGSKSFKGMTSRADGTKFARLVESSKKVKPWERAVCAALLARPGFAMFRGAVVVELEFRFDRPASHGRKRLPCWSKGAGDVDKLARSTLDALTAAGVWNDDSQVVRLVVDRRYCGEGERPGCLIRVTDPFPGLVKPEPKGKRDARRQEGGDAGEALAPAAGGRPRRLAV